MLPDLDADKALFTEVGNAARVLHEAATRYRSGERAAGARFRTRARNKGVHIGVASRLRNRIGLQALPD